MCVEDIISSLITGILGFRSLPFGPEVLEVLGVFTHIRSDRMSV